MPLFLTLQLRIDEALDAIRTHPTHEFKAVSRAELLQAFGESEAARAAQDWLAVLSARKVESLYFESASKIYPHNSKSQRMASHLLTLAERVLNGKSTQDAIRIKAGDLHYVVGNLMNKRLSGGACLALNAALQALNQVVIVNANPFRYVDGISKFLPGEKNADGTQKYLLGRDMSDFVLSNGGYNDAAGSAAAAWAVPANYQYQAPPEHQPDAQKTLEFWTWWLNEALPEAWQLAAG